MCERLPVFALICSEQYMPFVVFLFLKIQPAEWQRGEFMCFWLSEGELSMGRACWSECCFHLTRQLFCMPRARRC